MHGLEILAYIAGPPPLTNRQIYDWATLPLHEKYALTVPRYCTASQSVQLRCYRAEVMV